VAPERFIDNEKNKLGTITLVKEQLVANTVNDNVKTGRCEGRTHQRNKDGVRSKDSGCVILSKAGDYRFMAKCVDTVFRRQQNDDVTRLSIVRAARYGMRIAMNIEKVIIQLL
jgi:hypothetical protein